MKWWMLVFVSLMAAGMACACEEFNGTWMATPTTGERWETDARCRFMSVRKVVDGHEEPGGWPIPGMPYFLDDENCWTTSSTNPRDNRVDCTDLRISGDVMTKKVHTTLYDGTEFDGDQFSYTLRRDENGAVTGLAVEDLKTHAIELWLKQ